MYKVESYVEGVKDSDLSKSSWNDVISILGILPPLSCNHQIVISCV